MSVTFRLEHEDESDPFNLATRMKRGSLRIQRAKDGKVTVTMTLLFSGTESSTRTGIQALEDILEDAIEWGEDTLLSNSVWLRWITEGETAKRSLVDKYSLVPVSAGARTPHLLNRAGAWRLALTLHRGFEAITALTSGPTQTTDYGGYLYFSGDLSGGTLDSRIDEMTIKPLLNSYNKMWIGLRPVIEGLSSGFNGRLECEAGTGITDTSSVADGTASATFKMQTTFATDETMAYRFYMKLTDTGGVDPYNYIGRYLILMRAKVSAGTIGVRIGTSWGAPGVDLPQQKGEIQYLTNTSWELVPMGEISIPSGNFRQVMRDSVNLDEFALFVEAERVSGAGMLDCDIFIFMPSDHYVTWDKAAIDFPAEHGKIYTHEDGAVRGVVQSISSPKISRIPTPGSVEWQYPKEGAILVFAAQEDGNHTLSSADITLSILKRWLSYRD